MLLLLFLFNYYNVSKSSYLVRKKWPWKIKMRQDIRVCKLSGGVAMSCQSHDSNVKSPHSPAGGTKQKELSLSCESPIRFFMWWPRPDISLRSRRNKRQLSFSLWPLFHSGPLSPCNVYFFFYFLVGPNSLCKTWFYSFHIFNKGKSLLPFYLFLTNSLFRTETT